VLKRYVDGADGEPFFQKRAPEQRPAWVETVDLRFPSGRTAREIVVRDAAQLLWIVNLGCIDLNPHPVRADDLDHPDELRVDLDPGPGVGWDDVRRVALLVRAVLDEHGLRGWPRRPARAACTSTCARAPLDLRPGPARGAGPGPRGGAARARAGQQQVVEGGATRRLPRLQPERQGSDGGLGLVGAPHSRRPRLDAARVGRGARLRPGAFTLVSAPARFAERGDASAGIDAAAGSLDALLALSAAQEAAGLGDAPWPPHYKKQRDEPPRVAPSRRKAAGSGGGRQSSQPLITVAKAAHKEDALAGVERWKARHPEAAARLQVDDVLVDSMRGRSSTWTRVRINLRHVPEGERPAEEAPDPDYDPWGASGSGRAASRAPKTRSSS
jgi:hypothetical protein